MYFWFMADRQTDPADASLEFLRLAGEPVRWHLLQELARSDRHVRELTELVGRPHWFLPSGKLRSAGLVVARRSSADGRDAYYTVALDRFSELLAAAGRSLHPGLQLTRATLAPAAARPPGRPARLLFLCTGNSARSQIAEALAVARSAGLAEAFSAGSHPKPVHPYAARVLRERGISFGDRRSKPLSLFAATRFDHVITLCDKVRGCARSSPASPGAPARFTGASRTRPPPAATTRPP